MEDEIYHPPSEVEQQRLQLARERSNKISKILGDYLLKGYKMLGSTCNKCQTILLEDRQGEDYCVGCTEVDCAPVNQPDVTHVHVGAHSLRPVERDFPAPREVNTTIDELDLARKYDTDVMMSSEADMEREVVDISFKMLIDQIKWANECLANIGNNTSQRTEYVTLIKSCYETLQLLRPGYVGSNRLLGRP